MTKQDHTGFKKDLEIENARQKNIKNMDKVFKGPMAENEMEKF